MPLADLKPSRCFRPASRVILLFICQLLGRSVAVGAPMKLMMAKNLPRS